MPQGLPNALPNAPLPNAPLPNAYPNAYPAGVYPSQNLAQTLPPVGANPFRTGGATAVGNGPTLPGTIGGTTTTDPLLTDIDKQLGQLQDQSATKFQAGVSLRSRTGTGGEDKLTEAMAPIEATFSPGGGSATFKLQATPTTLNAGNYSGGAPVLFGYLPKYGEGSYIAGELPTGQANGIGLDAAMMWRFVNADIGTSPLGFRVANVVGGLELAPKVGTNAVLRLTAERRAVDDSVLSFAGVADPVTGRTWGGVVRNRGHVQIEGSEGLLDMYAGGGYSMLTGVNTASNTEIEAGAGGSYPVFRWDDQQIRVGLDLVYFAYQKNLSAFSFGNGGYFSPQSYMAALVPVTYSGKDDNFSWSVTGSAGYQSFNERASPLFPTDSYNQALLNTYGPPNGYPATSTALSSTGFSGGLKGNAEYALTDNVAVGARGSLQHTGNWTETTGLFYARYMFGGAQ